MTMPLPSPLPSALRGTQLVVVDVEGNGQQPPEIIEIAVLPIDGQPVNADAVRSWLVRPQVPVATIVTRKVHGITNADLADCPEWAAVSDEIEAAIEGRILVAHNASVERNALAAHLPNWNPPLVLDTLRLAKKVWTGLPAYGLDKLIDRGQLDTSTVTGQGYHRAGYDTWAAWQLLCALIHDGELNWTDLLRYAALPEFLPAGEPEGGLW